MPFVKTERQIKACELLNSHRHCLLFGGSRSGKTTIIIRNIILRAIKRPSRHLIVRHVFNHAKLSLWLDTIPKVLDLCFPGLPVKLNKTDYFIELPTVCGRTSQIFVGGISDRERIEKVLGNEYSTVYCNECSQIAYEAISILRTRLAENTGLPLRFYYDCNPSGKKHWSYQEFIEKWHPGTKETTSIDSAYLLLNPLDNAINLSPAYIEELEALPLRQRQRFLEGLYLSDVEGALWTDAMISAAKSREHSEIIKTIVAVDPSVSHNPDSDECGIVVCSKDDMNCGVVEEDLSGKYSTKVWAQRSVNAYHTYNANAIVAEVNQGGDLVEDAIKAVDPTVKVIKVRASKGKFARAEPITVFYEQNQISHKKQMPDLESEMTEWVPENTKESPNRIDALVWGLTELLLPEIKRREFRVG
jgi:phage terminase large subunit-like protein